MSNNTIEGKAILNNVLSSLRYATVLLLLDRTNLWSRLNACDVTPIKDFSINKILSAAEALGIIKKKEESFELDEQLKLDNSEWKSLISIIEHQITYLELASRHNVSEDKTPRLQFEEDKYSYLDFLKGVDVSHRNHAKWLSHQSEVKNCKKLIDLGGGLGTFSKEWVRSFPNREAVVFDLPGVTKNIDINSDLIDRLETGDLDLNEFTKIPETADLYLLANVLHLFENWKQVVIKVIQNMPKGALLGIFEADNSTKSGILFDLQVHMRSGFKSGLLSSKSVKPFMENNGLFNLKTLYTVDSDDPFNREYRLWIGQKS